MERKVSCTAYAPHDLGLERVARDEPVHVDDLLLAEAVRAVHGLQVLARVPVVLHEDDRVGAREREAEAADLRREQQHVDARVGIECLHDAVALLRRHAAVEAHVRHVGHVAAEEVVLDDVEHLLDLAEDQDAMLRHSRLGR